jgi:hypothetical protein
MLFWSRSSVGPLSTILLLHGTALEVGCLSDKAKNIEPPATCMKAGDSCTFSPGKLGTCVKAAGGNTSLVCQSQH